MNTLLKTIALITAAGFPAAFSAESFGFSLPTYVDAPHMFGAFVIALTVLTLLSDYAETKPLCLDTCAKSANATTQTALPLAA